MNDNNNYKVLVLSGLGDNNENVLKSATRMAQIIGGEIELFHVRKPTKVVERESHLSAVRVIKDHYVLIENELKTMCDSVHKNSNVKATHFFAFGNIKNEIEKHLEKTKPDLVVVGKKTSISPRFMGDNILPFILRKFQGTVMVADNEKVLEANSKLSLGLFNSKLLASNLSYVDAILSNSEGPIRAYEIADSSDTRERENTIPNTVSYVFEKTDQAFQTINNYMDMNKINLLCVGRKPANTSKASGLSNSELNTLAQNLKVPLLLCND